MYKKNNYKKVGKKMKKNSVTNEELNIVLNSCIDELRRIQYKRKNRRVLSYSDLILEMNAAQTILIIDDIRRD